MGKKAGLAGKTEEEELQAEVILEHVNDFVKGILEHFYESWAYATFYANKRKLSKARGKVMTDGKR